jgi:uncharacterized 2Fe-2S/4Fe-4S cluster protein (DUF4445 family)
VSEFRVVVQPEDRVISAEDGEKLMEALRRAGIPVRSACGGRGVCGRCSVSITESGATETVLACQRAVTGDAEVTVPASSRLEHWVSAQEGLAFYDPPELRVPISRDARPMVRVETAALPAPTASDNVSDLDRLTRFLAAAYPDTEISVPPATARHLPRILREADWEVVTCVARTGRRRLTVTDVRSASRTPGAVAMALDCGTTTLEVALLDVVERQVVGHAACLNPQCTYGADVISRIVHAERREGLLSLHRVIRDAVRALAERALEQAGRTWQDLQLVLAAGNTTMLHLLHHVDPSHIRREPYVPAFTTWEPVPLADLGIAGGAGSVLMSLPSVSSYVGADVVAGLLATGTADSPHPVGLIDLGTNGEIAIGCRDWVLCCASSAGPCFEGGGVTWGCPATDGAISRVSVEGGDAARVECQTLQNLAPVGICGSGILDAVGALYEAQIIDRRGRLAGEHPLVRQSPGGELEVVLAAASGSAFHEDIVLTGGDIENVVRAKAAIFSGLESCLQAAGLSENQLGWLALSGGFGTSLDVGKAIALGLLPPLAKERVLPSGNTALRGVCMALLDEDVWAKAASVARMTTTLELSSDPGYMDRYSAALFIPHTDLARFGREGESEPA